MRRHREHVVYHSILRVLREPGCPFCRFLKEFQADCLQRYAERELHHLCNFHTWGFAAVQDAPDAARIFLKLIDEAAPLSSGNISCDVCRLVVDEEDLRIREFVSSLHRSDISDWLKTNATLCIPHGLKLRPKLPPALVPRIDNLMENYRQQLSIELEHLRDQLVPESNRTGWGAVGRAAEFLVAQRGLRS